MSRAAAALAVAACFSAAGCGGADHAQANVQPADVKVVEAPDVNVLTVDKPQQFTLATVSERRVADELQVTGTVAPDVNRTVPVVSLSSGRVVQVHARLGDDVRRGQVLLTISSQDVTQAFADYQKFQADEILAKTQLERSQLLFSKGAIAQKDLEVAQDTYHKAQVDTRSAAQRIRILGADTDRPTPLLEIRAPISGTIVDQQINPGTGVKSLDNTPNLFTIADLSRVWILCDVYENNLSQVHLGDSADVRLNAYPNTVRRGRVGNVGKMLDPNTRAVKVRLEMDNPGLQMRPNMFASVTFTSRGSKTRAVIPQTAILHLHDKDWVYRAEGGGRFRRLEIQTGPAMPDAMQEVVSGVNPGDRVVAQALQFSSAAETK